MYGPRIVWIFPPQRDILNVPDSDGCTRDNRATFVSGIFYNVVEVFDTHNWQTSLGITGGELQDFASNIDGPPIIRLISNVCFDTVGGLVFILDAAEQRLNKLNSSLRYYIGDETKQNELKEIVSAAVMDIDINLYVGRIKYKPGEQKVMSGVGFQQVQGPSLENVLVFHDSSDVEDSNRYKFPNKMIWQTPDGRPPKSKPTTMKEIASVNLVVASIYTAVAICLCLLLLVVPALKCYEERTNTALKITAICLLGMLPIQALTIIYPFTYRLVYCRAAPILALCGFSIVFWSIFTRLHSKNSTVLISSGKRLKFQRANDIVVTTTIKCFVVVLAVVMAILICLWYALVGPPTVKIEVETSYNDLSDIVTITEFQHCTSEGYDLQMLIVTGMLACLLAVGWISLVAVAFSSKTDTHPLTKNGVLAASCVVPTFIAIVLLIFVDIDMNITYYVLVPIIHLKTIGLITLAWFQEFGGNATRQSQSSSIQPSIKRSKITK